jgi:hypothetical protein
MGNINRTIALIFIVVIAVSSLSLLSVSSVSAQTATPIPTPSVPTFTLQVKEEKGTVPTTYSLNSSSGQIEAQLGYDYTETQVFVIINNQPLTGAYDGTADDNYNGFYYNIRIKRSGDTSDSWSDLYTLAQGYPSPNSGPTTNISIGNPFENETGTFDVQVEALIGYITPGHNFPPIPYGFSGQTSDWSDTQTVTAGYYIVNQLSPTPDPSSPSTYPTTTSTPTATVAITPNNSLSGNQQLINMVLIFAVAVLGVTVISLVVYVTKIKSRINQPAKQ